MMYWLSENAAVIGVVFFFVTFVAIVVWTFWPGKKEKFNHCANIPLEDDDGK